MTKTVVYLAGKMSGLGPQEMNEWRFSAEEMIQFGDNRFNVFNPADTSLSSEPTGKEIVHSNKWQIRNSDVVLMELDHEDVSIGTIGEMVFAAENHKPIIAWGKAEKVINHPWVQEHVTVLFDKLQDACDYIRLNYSK